MPGALAADPVAFPVGGPAFGELTAELTALRTGLLSDGGPLATGQPPGDLLTGLTALSSGGPLDGEETSEGSALFATAGRRLVADLGAAVDGFALGAPAFVTFVFADFLVTFFGPGLNSSSE